MSNKKMIKTCKAKQEGSKIQIITEKASNKEIIKKNNGH
jgi:hypothetical protein